MRLRLRAVSLIWGLFGCTPTPDQPPRGAEPPERIDEPVRWDEPSPAPPAPTQENSESEEAPPDEPAARSDDPTQIYAWTPSIDSNQTLRLRALPPPGYRRIPVEEESFAAWLRTLPVKPGRPEVLLHDGRRKGNQSAHEMVIDIDTGAGDLQQCADAVMRLRAEYLYSRQRYDDIHFNFTSGDRASYAKWRQGYRPRVSGNDVSWALTSSADDSYQGFRNFLVSVFSYAGTASLSKEMRARPLSDIQAGDVFIIGGFPGHAVIVLDVAVRADSGQKVFLLGQSYMPAQDMHVLRNPNDSTLSPWYSTDFGDVLHTPEWDFEANQLKHFAP